MKNLATVEIAPIDVGFGVEVRFTPDRDGAQEICIRNTICPVKSGDGDNLRI